MVGQVGRTKWDAVYLVLRNPRLYIPIFIFLGLVIGVFGFTLLSGLTNCSAIDGSISCSRTGSVLVERNHITLIGGSNSSCKELVAVPPFLTSVVRYGGITGVDFQTAFAEIFSAALGDGRYRSVLIDPYPSAESQKEREKLLANLTVAEAMRHSKDKLAKYSDVADQKKGVLVGHIYALSDERRDTGDPATVFATFRMMNLDGSIAWQAAQLLAIESVPPIVTKVRDIGGVGGFEAAFVMVNDLILNIDSEISCRQ